MSHNLGSYLPRKRRRADPMQTFDSLPQPLRNWLAQAALPWSPNSARKIWSKARAKGLNDQDALGALARAEAKTLQRERSLQDHRP